MSKKDFKNKQIITTDNYKLEWDNTSLDNTIKCINKYTKLFNDKGLVFNINKMQNYREYCDEIYNNYLQSILVEFGVSHKEKEIKTWTYRLTNSMYSDMCHGRCNEVLEAIRDINRQSHSSHLFDMRYITINDNVASKSKYADELLLEYNSIYTENDKQNKALAKLHKIAEMMNEFDKEYKSCSRHLFTTNNTITPLNFLKIGRASCRERVSSPV